MGDLRYKGADTDGAILSTPNGLRHMPKGEWVDTDELGMSAEQAKAVGDDYEYRATQRRATKGDDE